MRIIAHRGLWIEENEKNKLIAFERAKAKGIGLETDFRDYCGELVISHDVADETCEPAESLFKLYRNCQEILALNIKADSIQRLLKQNILNYNIQNYFCFDMSIPDTIGYIDEGLSYFVRESEYETINYLYSQAAGVWIDGLKEDTWISTARIQEHRKNGKLVCIVSSELHQREYKNLWSRLKVRQIIEDDGVILCTDYPEYAKRFFYEESESNYF